MLEYSRYSRISRLAIRAPPAASPFVPLLAVGAADAPSFPGNGRITSAWFPAGERGLASAIFNSVTSRQSSTRPVMPAIRSSRPAARAAVNAGGAVMVTSAEKDAIHAQTRAHEPGVLSRGPAVRARGQNVK
jgi:hypothetical protein